MRPAALSPLRISAGLTCTPLAWLARCSCSPTGGTHGRAPSWRSFSRPRSWGAAPRLPVPLTEDVPARGSPEHYYSEQKAACEAELAEITKGSSLEVFILRPCIVAGPKAPILADVMPWRHLPGAVQSAARALPLLKMPVPDPGFPLQLVHHDDVAAAIALAATTDAPPGAYNIAGDGEVSISDIVTALGGRPVRVPAVAASAASGVIAHVPFTPSALEWLHVARASVVMDTSKAKSQLGWKPKYTSAETLQALAEAV